MSGDNDVVSVMWICVVVCAEWLGIQQALLITRGPPPPIGDCIRSDVRRHGEEEIGRDYDSTTSRGSDAADLKYTKFDNTSRN